jgi:hypothetical protein
MRHIVFRLAFLFSCVLIANGVCGQNTKTATTPVALDSKTAFETVNGKVEIVTYRGRRAVRLAPPSGQEMVDGSMLAILPGTDFKDGTIELDVSGAPRQGAEPGAKGFIGVAFRVQPHGAHAEYFYLRPVNARLEDQLVRNHSVQYVSPPEFTWERLRKETPGVYESYVDLEPGAWTRIKVVVSGTKARLYVNNATQPCLVVNDLKLGDNRGQIALWAHNTTVAYFSNLRVK